MHADPEQTDTPHAPTELLMETKAGGIRITQVAMTAKTRLDIG